MASISCSVILMISCFRTVGRKNPPIYLLGNVPRGKRALLSPSGIPRDLCQRHSPPRLSFRALCRRSKPTLLPTPFVVSAELRTTSINNQVAENILFLADEEPVMPLTVPLVRVCVLARASNSRYSRSVSNHFSQQKGLIRLQ